MPRSSRRARSSRPRSNSQRLPRSITPAARRAGNRFARLVTIMHALRAPDGCPWDRRQTLESLKPFVLEETYEVLEAIDRQDHASLRDEIGDLMFEGVFLAQICAEARHFSIADAVAAIVEKLIRRHPHVFGAGHGSRLPPRRLHSPEDVVEQWERLKTQEAGASQGILHGIPRTLPALLRAQEIGSRAAAVGFDWDRPVNIVDKIDEEVGELRRAVSAERPTRIEEEMGDLFFAVANLARKLGIEPESSLQKANDKFARRFRELERRLRARGQSVHEATLEEMEKEWGLIKSDRENP